MSQCDLLERLDLAPEINTDHRYSHGFLTKEMLNTHKYVCLFFFVCSRNYHYKVNEFRVPRNLGQTEWI